MFRSAFWRVRTLHRRSMLERSEQYGTAGYEFAKQELLIFNIA